MGILVKKFGGTSVGTLERIQNVAKKIKESIETANSVAVVVSAMAGETNRLVAYANEIGIYEGNREYDVIASSGEQVSAGLVAAALNNIGIKAKSYLAWQLPITTDDAYGQANILSVDSARIEEDLQKHIVPVVCGFQGISKSKSDITTIGRGGSDLTAVALAASIRADLCEIFSDVDGVYTADPNKIISAKLIDFINYKEMLELSLNGAKVLQARSVDYAMKNNVKIRAASSFVNTSGTIVSDACSLDKQIVGIGTSDSLVSFKVSDGIHKRLKEEMESNFVKAIFEEKHADNYVITINQQDMRVIFQLLEKIATQKPIHNFYNSPYVNISLVGFGVGHNYEIIEILKKILFRFDIKSIIEAENSVNIILNKQYEIEVLKLIHDTFF